MTAAELARRVRRVQLRARRTAGELISSAWHSAFKGQGMEFQEVREYVPGDDTRSIDWNVTARVGRPYVKRFAEERDLTVLLLLDASRSQEFGAAGALKKDVAVEICATLAFTAAGNRDEAGLILFSSEVELYVPPGSGESHMLRLIREVLVCQPRARGTSLSSALEFLGKVRRRRSLVFVISDFQDHDFEAQLRIASRRHDVVAISLFDAREVGLPDCGLLECQDPETGVRVLLDTSDAGVRAAYTAAAHARAARLGELFREAKVDHLRIEAGSDYIPRLVSFLRMRGRRD